MDEDLEFVGRDVGEGGEGGEERGKGDLEGGRRLKINKVKEKKIT